MKKVSREFWFCGVVNVLFFYQLKVAGAQTLNLLNLVMCL